MERLDAPYEGQVVVECRVKKGAKIETGQFGADRGTLLNFSNAVRLIPMVKCTKAIDNLKQCNCREMLCVPNSEMDSQCRSPVVKLLSEIFSVM